MAMLGDGVKLVLYGATGMIGSRLLAEALMRGHHVTAVQRDPSKYAGPTDGVTVAKGDVRDAASVAAVAKGHDAVLCAVGGSPDLIRVAPQRLLEGLAKAGVKRLLWVGGAGSLEVRPGVLLQDTRKLPAAWKEIARAHTEALEVLRANKTLAWTCVSPAARIEPGERTASFRLGRDELVVGKKGESRISAEDFAVAFLDETEYPNFVRRRFTLGYM
jgi:putative NADH-flavin reductase